MLMFVARRLWSAIGRGTALGAGLLSLVCAPAAGQLSDGTLPPDFPAVVQLSLPLLPDVGYPYFETTIEGQQGVLILDTGAPSLFVNSARVPVGLQLGPALDSSTVNDAAGQVSGTSLHRLRTLQWGGPNGPTLTDVGAQRLDLQNLESRLASVLGGRSLLGILGLSQLRPFMAIFDYNAHQLVLHRVDSIGNLVKPLSGPTPAATVTLSLQGDHLYVPVQVGVDTIYLNLDTGSRRGILDSAVAVRLGAHLRPQDEKFESVGASGQKISNSLVQIDRLWVGGMAYDTLKIGVRPYGDGDGELGSPFFSRKRWGLNFTTQTLYIWH